MKRIFKVPKTLMVLVLMTLIGSGVSCNDKKGKTDSKIQIEDDENFAGSSKREDICELITEDDVRSVFSLSQELEIEKSESNNAICSYDWKVPNENHVYYSVNLNFARDGKHTNSQIDAIWESQNEALYNRFQLQDVSGVGDRASWSELGGGQLRVVSNGFMFYVTIKLTHTASLEKNKPTPEYTQSAIEKASTLAKIVIKKL